MRTTLDLDADVLQAAKEIAEMRNSTTGKVLSELARKALKSPRTSAVRNGVPLLPTHPDAPVITMQRVNDLRDEWPES